MRFVYRHLAFLGDESRRAAQASECAAEQDHFWEYHDILFDNWAGENKGAFNDHNLLAFAEEIGLDSPRFQSCLESNRYEDRVQRDIQAARSLGVRTTPTVFINERRLDGLKDYSTYRGMIQAELAGVP